MSYKYVGWEKVARAQYLMDNPPATPTTPTTPPSINNSILINSSSSPYLIKIDDYLIIVTINNSSVTLVLPVLSSVSVGKEYVIKTDSTASVSNQVIVQATGTDLIDGQRTFVLDDAYSALTVISSTQGWMIF